MFENFLDPPDAAQAANLLRKLQKHDVSRWALTGSFAIELHILRSGRRARLRPLRDIDFLVSSFDCLPETLSRNFMFRHVHPDDPPAKILLQAVDAELGVRVDVFRAYGLEMTRLLSIEVDGFSLKLASLPDLAARHACLCWDLIDGKQVHPKYVQDFLRLIDVAVVEDVEDVWREHRKPHSPENFSEAASALLQVIASRSDLMVAWDYSTNVNEVCLRCQETKTFPLANGRQIYSILGYV